MRPCLGCFKPALKERCPDCTREWERARQARFPQRNAYRDPAYKRYRTWVLTYRPPCHLCGRPGADTVDHLLPLSQGGTNEPGNLRSAHKACNVRKHGRT